MNIESIVDYAKQFIEKSIVTGGYAPGEKVKEEDIASQLGISRPPVREAFKTLESEGLITKKPRRGAFVSEIKEKDIREVYMLKTALYGLATDLAMDAIHSEGILKLEKVVQMMERCVEKQPGNILKYQALHGKFHNILIDAARNERLKRIVLTLDNQTKRFSYKSLSEKKHLVSSLQYHKQISEAIKEGNKKLALRLTREHIVDGMNVLLETFRVKGEIIQTRLTKLGKSEKDGNI